MWRWKSMGGNGQIFIKYNLCLLLEAVWLWVSVSAVQDCASDSLFCMHIVCLVPMPCLHAACACLVVRQCVFNRCGSGGEGKHGYWYEIRVGSLGIHGCTYIGYISLQLLEMFCHVEARAGHGLHLRGDMLRVLPYSTMCIYRSWHSL